MATYNCSDSTNQAYGVGNYSTCDASSGATAIGAPGTGVFSTITDGASMTILLPVAAAIFLTIIATFVVRKKRAKTN
jgi:hypothetical protein